MSISNFAHSSSWMVTSNPVGNPLTGIKGDAIQLSRLVTPPFFLDRDVLFVFSHHKVDRNSFFNVRAKRFDKNQETTLFEQLIYIYIYIYIYEILPI
uniref:Sema domain-containing protein n=1 Tax=Heterorhabditis bacteriophora TaxID=37862 RepID=A0A1I7WZH4_HETBA